MINIVIPMAGAGSRFAKVGYEKPKPFIDIFGTPMILHVLDNLKVANSQFVLITRKEHMIKEKEIIEKIKKEYPVYFIDIEDLTEGAACTVLYGHKSINNDSPLLIANSDQLIDIDINHFIFDAVDRKLDGSILTFEDTHPKWSYARVDEKGYVTEVREKEVISSFATVGIYYFAKGSTFIDSAIDMIVRNERVNNEFYVCPTYNYAIRNGAKIGIYNINKSAMHGVGTPEDLNKYLEVLKTR